LAAHRNGLGFFIGFWAKAFDFNHGYLLFGEDFNVAHEPLLVQRHQAHGFAT
jgi:hypothetical protein